MFISESVLAVSFHVPAIEISIPEKFQITPTPPPRIPPPLQQHPLDPFFEIDPQSVQDDLFVTLFFAKGRLGFGTTDASQILIREIAKDSTDNLAKFTLKVPASRIVRFDSVDFSIRPINKKDPQVQRFGLSTNAFNLMVVVLHRGPVFTWKNTIAGRQSVYNTLPNFEIDRGHYRWIKVQIISFSELISIIEKVQTDQLNNLQGQMILKIQIQDDLLYQDPD